MSNRRAIAAVAGVVAGALLMAAPGAAGAAVVFETSGTNAAAIQPTVDAFRTALGNPNNGNVVGTQPAGRRQITWDGADADSAPSRLPADFFNAIAPRGVIFGGSPTIQFQQSADGVGNNATNTVEEFGQINAGYPTAFGIFSAPRLFSALNSNVYDVDLFVPGSLTRAQATGFGAVFTDVDVAGSTKLEFFDRFGAKLFERQVLPMAGDASLSFLGVVFPGHDVAKVRVTSGAAALGPNDISQGGASDIVAADDFIYGEPAAQPVPAVTFTSAQFSGAEGGTATITVDRSGDTQATVRAGVSLTDGTATAGSDYEPTGGTVTFAPGETQKSIAVPLTADDAQEATETVNLTLDPVTSNGMVAPTTGPDAAATLSIENVAPAAPPPDTKAPLLEISVNGRHPVNGKHPTIPLFVFCDEPCTFVAGGQLRVKGGGKAARVAVRTKAVPIADVQEDVAPLAFQPVVVKLSSKAARLARSAIRNGGRATANLNASATDAAGNRTTTVERVGLG